MVSCDQRGFPALSRFRFNIFYQRDSLAMAARLIPFRIPGVEELGLPALAREFALPRSLHHFIEAHHGTTLVEFFYHRARKRAAESAEATGEEVAEPSEIEYRYPGPKPHTKEVAIIMLCDAVESAARAMADWASGNWPVRK